MALVKGIDPWQTALKGAAAPLSGEAAMRPGFEAGPVLLGLVCHFAVSIGWGLLFGLVAYGVAWGIVVWLGMFYVVLPHATLGHRREHGGHVPAHG